MKQLSLLLIIVIIAGKSKAQFLKVGPKVGANLVKIEGQSFDKSFELGYYAGGFFELKLTKNLYLMPELLFAENKLEPASAFSDIYQDILVLDNLKEIKLQSLSIPISINWKIANILALSAGAQFTRNIEKGEGLLKSATAAITDGNISAMAGGNIHFGKFRIHARYMWGLKDVNNIDGRDEWKQQTVQAGIGFVF